VRFLKKVEEKVRRYEEARKQLEDPSVSHDQNRLRDLGKEVRSLEPITQLYRDYLKVEEETDQVQKILSDKGQTPDIVEMAKHELETLETRHKKITRDIENRLIQEDPMLSKNVILEIRAGTGGLEAGLFAADLFRMYTKFAQNSGFKIETLSSSPNEAGGFKEIIAGVAGHGAYGRFKFESGTHRVQRVPATEAQGRIHTSAVTWPSFRKRRRSRWTSSPKTSASMCSAPAAREDRASIPPIPPCASRTSPRGLS
jgi:peptide chain release factor 1